MSFFVTSVRRASIVRACGLFILALALAVLPWVMDVDSEGRVFCFAFAGLVLLGGIFNLWRARQTLPSQTETRIPELAPETEQIRYFRRALWCSIIAFPAMSIWIASDLHDLESGAVERVSIWAPIAFIYDRFGYWAAVVSPLVLGGICCFVLMHRLRQLTATSSTGPGESASS